MDYTDNASALVYSMTTEAVKQSGPQISIGGTRSYGDRSDSHPSSTSARITDFADKKVLDYCNGRK